MSTDLKRLHNAQEGPILGIRLMQSAPHSLLVRRKVHSLGGLAFGEEVVIPRQLHGSQGGVAKLHHGRLVQARVGEEQWVLGQGRA